MEGDEVATAEAHDNGSDSGFDSGSGSGSGTPGTPDNPSVTRPDPEDPPADAAELDEDFDPAASPSNPDLVGPDQVGPDLVGSEQEQPDPE